MSRIEDSKKLIDTYLKTNKIFYIVSASEDILSYEIDGGTFPLCFQFEFFNEKQEMDYCEEYCVLQTWIPLSDYGEENLTYDTDTIKSIDDVIPELEQGLYFYKEKLKIINTVERKIREIKEILKENEIEYHEDIDFKTFIIY